MKVSVGGLSSGPEYLTLKKDEKSNANTDGAICYVEYGSEEDEVIAPPEWDPFRQETFPKREVQHVYHLTLQKSSIASVFGEQSGDLTITFAEYHAVESTVQHIAYGPRQNKGEGNYSQCWSFLFPEITDVPGDAGDREDPEQTQGQFAPLAAEFHAKSHAVVLREMDDEPVGQAKFLTNGHMGLDPELQGLVDQENGKDDDPGPSQRLTSVASSPRCSMSHGVRDAIFPWRSVFR